MKFVRKIWRLGLVLAVVLSGLGLFPAAQPAHAQNDCKSTDTGVFCNSDQSACVNNPCTENQQGNLVKSCTPGKSTAERQVNKLITYGENKQGCVGGSALWIPVPALSSKPSTTAPSVKPKCASAIPARLPWSRSAIP